MGAKRYYWLKLGKDFFKTKSIKKLRKIAGGDTFTIIYLKMLLLTTDTDGIIEFEGIEQTLAEELALELDEEIDNVKMTIAYLQQVKLMEEINNDKFMLQESIKMTGSESKSAERVRKHRENKQLSLQCNIDVTNSNEHKEKELELEKKKEKKKDTKHKHGTFKNVLLTDKEYQRLKTEYNNIDSIIDWFSAYIEEKGYKSKSHNLTIRRWVIEAYNKNNQKPKELHEYSCMEEVEESEVFDPGLF